MSSTRALKTRTRSVKSTRQITKAMQLVAASKMRRTQDATKASEAYTRAARELLTYLSGQGLTNQHPLFVRREIKKRLLIVVAGDKGLAGAYNGNIMKLYLKELNADANLGVETETIAIGRRATQFVSRLKNVELTGIYENLPDKPSSRDLYAILDTAQSKFLQGEIDAVDIIYTEFTNSLIQTALTRRLLPAGFEEITVRDSVRDAAYEPSLEAVLDSVTHRLIGAQIFQALLDARASEHSMRMVAMKNATDNASDLIEDLTLAINQARQSAITQELAEISGGVEAMK